MQIKRASPKLSHFFHRELSNRREMFLVLRQFQFVKIAYALFRTYKQERKVTAVCIKTEINLNKLPFSTTSNKRYQTPAYHILPNKRLSRENHQRSRVFNLPCNINPNSVQTCRGNLRLPLQIAKNSAVVGSDLLKQFR